MGVRPPPSGGEGESEIVEFGIAAVDARLDEADVTFPATSAETVDALSNPQIAYDPKGHTVALEDVIERADRDRFGSRTELLNALHPVFEDLRTSSATGLLSQVRSYLPL